MTRQISDRSAAARAPLFLALGAVGFLSSPALAANLTRDGADTGGAEQSDTEQRDNPGNDVLVQGQRQETRLESPRATAPLLDTPQAVTVISDQVLRRQNLLTLRDALTTIPGITFGAGEGGGGYGDSINLRGYSANNDITQDGVRDSAQYTRSDPFNLQQIEIYNGANSVFNGSGSVGGTINLVSKVPQADNLTILSAAIGTDDYFRGTVDSNWRISPQVAVRLNAMIHRNDVPGRDVENYRRWGVAPAITVGMEGSTRITLAYVHQRDDNVPVYGVPFFRNQINDGPLPGTDSSDYYGYRNLDEQEITVDRLTLTLHQDITDNVRMRSLARWQRVDQFSVTSAPQGTFCLAQTGLQPVPTTATGMTGAACNAAVTNVTTGNGPAVGTINVAVPPGFWQPSGPRGLVRDQSNELWYSQTDFTVGERQRRRPAQHPRCRRILRMGGLCDRERLARAQRCRCSPAAAAREHRQSNHHLYRPDQLYSHRPLPRLLQHPGDLCLRHAGDRPAFRTQCRHPLRMGRRRFRSIGLSAYPPGTAPLAPEQLAPQRNDESLFSYRFGAVYKPTRNTSVYVAIGNSRTPSIASVRADCTQGSGATFVNFCGAAPETARTYEIGLKADLFDRRLNFTAALFRNERSNFRVPSNDPAAPNPQVVERPGARRRTGARPVRQYYPGMADLRQLHLAGLEGAAERLGFLSGQYGQRGLRQQRRDPRSAARRRTDADAGTFGQPVHHLPPAFRAADRLRPHLPGQLRHPSADPFAADPVTGPMIS